MVKAAAESKTMQPAENYAVSLKFEHDFDLNFFFSFQRWFSFSMHWGSVCLWILLINENIWVFSLYSSSNLEPCLMFSYCPTTKQFSFINCIVFEGGLHWLNNKKWSRLVIYSRIGNSSLRIYNARKPTFMVGYLSIPFMKNKFPNPRIMLIRAWKNKMHWLRVVSEPSNIPQQATPTNFMKNPQSYSKIK